MKDKSFREKKPVLNAGFKDLERASRLLTFKNFLKATFLVATIVLKLIYYSRKIKLSV